jgi:hypothetical protein
MTCTLSSYWIIDYMIDAKFAPRLVAQTYRLVYTRSVLVVEQAAISRGWMQTASQLIYFSSDKQGASTRFNLFLKIMNTT